MTLSALIHEHREATARACAVDMAPEERATLERRVRSTFDALSASVRTYVLEILRSRSVNLGLAEHEWDDIAQTVTMKTLRFLVTRVDSPESYVYRACRHTVIGHLRKYGRLVPTDLTTAEDGSVPLADARTKEAWDHAQWEDASGLADHPEAEACIEGLRRRKPRQFDALLAWMGIGPDSETLARKYDVDRATVHRWMSRAREDLEKCVRKGRLGTEVQP